MSDITTGLWAEQLLASKHRGQSPTPESPPIFTEYSLLTGQVTNPYPTHVSYNARRAFPSAEGFGAMANPLNAAGARQLYFVTSLSDENTFGTLRYAIESLTGPTYIIPLVSGYVLQDRPITINRPGVYYNNWFLPGAAKGLFLRNGWTGTGTGGGTIIIDGRANDLILRRLRIHRGYSQAVITRGVAEGADGDCITIRHGTGADSNLDPNRVILDHCYLAWSNDETFGGTGGHNVTVQHTYMVEPMHQGLHTKGTHSLTTLMGYGAKNWTYHHDAFVTGSQRNPRITPYGNATGPGIADVRNCLNHNNEAYGLHILKAQNSDDRHIKLNYDGNYWQRGPWTNASYWFRVTLENPGTPPEVWIGPNNIAEGLRALADDPWRNYGPPASVDADLRGVMEVLSAHDAPAIRQQTALAAKQQIVDYGGGGWAIDPDTGELKDVRDRVQSSREAQIRAYTGALGYAASQLYTANGYDTSLVETSITPTEFFTNYFDPWAASEGLSPGFVGCLANHPAYPDYLGIEVFMMKFTPHFPKLK